MTTLTIYVGLPGSGKTTFHKRGVNSPPYENLPIRVSLDDFRMNVLGHEFHGPSEPIVHAWSKQTVRYLLSLGYDVALDATNVKKGVRAGYISIAKECNAEVEAYEFMTLFEEVLKRNAERERNVPEEIILRMMASYEAPWYTEGFDKIYRVSTEGDVDFCPNEGPGPGAIIAQS